MTAGAATIKNVEYEAQINALRLSLTKDQRFARVQAKKALPEDSALIGVRPNLNSPKSAPVPVQTIHRGNKAPTHRTGRGFWNGTVLAYAPYVVLKNVFFNVHQEAREKIASGTNSKFPMASVDGEYCANAEFNGEGVEIRFNPKLHSSFVDCDGRAVKGAQEVTVFGNRVFARGEIYYLSRTVI